MYRDEPPPKPYQLIPFAAGQPRREKPAGHDRAFEQRLTGWLEIELEALTPVHVASGITDFVKAGGRRQLALVQVSIDRFHDDEPYRVISKAILPGSSIKGAIRSLAEALSPSCLLVLGRSTRSAAPRRLAACGGARSLCPVCRLFGTQDYQGQLSFEDAIVPDGALSLLGTPLLWQPARSQGRGLPGRYLARNEAKGRKLYEHREPATGPDPRLAIKEGTRIPLRLNFSNLAGAELGLLMTALGQHPDSPFFVKLGAGKPVGLGSIGVRIKTVVLASGAGAVKRAGRIGRARDVGERLESRGLVEQIKKWTEEAQEEEILLASQLKAVAQALRRENLHVAAPTGLY
jgi:CRISPR/Cas system CSM-associated protein Csm3 (group 7 of RAMP superfamily)